MSAELDHLRALALDCYRAAVSGADAGAATAHAIAETGLPAAERWWIASLGKAAGPMAHSGVVTLATLGIEPAGGLVVAPEAHPTPHPALESVAGDHPVPGQRSFDAARRLAALTTRVGPADALLVLLSGGTSALIGAPVAEVDGADLQALHEGLLRSGADIHVMNALRKRFSRWGAGRLAAAVAPARVVCLAVSDVAGDELASIGSGPCVGDPMTAADVQALVDRHGLREHVPLALREQLALVAAGEAAETPRPDDPLFARVEARVILRNEDALSAAAARARARGATARLADGELQGEAAEVGRQLADALLRAAAERGPADGPRCIVWGGETTVTLGDEAGRGGRCQELALSAAQRLHEAASAAGGADDAAAAAGRIVLLAAGTDGRDGPTDAAGAVVDAATWARIAGAGLDAAAALRRHDAHSALDRADALLRGGPSGTNVRDVVIGVVG